MNQFYKVIAVSAVVLGIILAAGTLALSRKKGVPAVGPEPTATELPRVISNTLPVSTAAGRPETDPGLEAGGLGGIGILGDSFCDEYQADDHRGGLYSSVTYNLAEILVRTRHFDLGPWGNWGEPRRTGYEYNWARSGATSQDLIRQGQHTGLAKQVTQGKVKYVLIAIGANDFSPYYGADYGAIYTGQMTEAQLANKIEGAVANVTQAVEAVQVAGAQHVVVTLFTQWELDPLLSTKFPDRVRRQRVAQAIEAVNRGLQTMAKDRGVVVLDQNALGMKLLPTLKQNRYLDVGGEWIDFLECGDEPHYSRLADQQHVGTVMSGVLANEYFINTFNANFGTKILPITNAEILQIAGLR